MRSIKNKAVSLALIGGLAAFGAACEAETDVVEPGQEAPADDTVGEDTTTDTESDTMTDDTATESDTMTDDTTATESETP
jgi:hypothetical protein